MLRKPLLSLLLMACFAAPAFADEPVLFKVIAKGGKLTPAQLNAPAGKRIKIEIANQGQTPIEFENLQLRVEKVLAPDAESYVVINPLKPGTYRFVDEFHMATGKLDLIVK